MRAIGIVMSLAWALMLGCSSGTLERSVRESACSESGAFNLGAEDARSGKMPRDSEFDGLCEAPDRDAAKHHYRTAFQAVQKSLPPGEAYACRLDGTRPGPIERRATREEAIQAVLSHCRSSGFSAFCDANRIRCEHLKER